MSLIHWIVTHMTIKSMTRHCRSCGRSQIVPRVQAKESVSCKSCGATIPPAR
jgi:ribosomal protein S27E